MTELIIRDPMKAQKIKPQSPWHEGETTIQASVGAVAKMAALGKPVVPEV